MQRSKHFENCAHHLSYILNINLWPTKDIGGEPEISLMVNQDFYYLLQENGSTRGVKVTGKKAGVLESVTFYLEEAAPIEEKVFFQVAATLLRNRSVDRLMRLSWREIEAFLRDDSTDNSNVFADEKSLEQWFSLVRFLQKEWSQSDDMGKNIELGPLSLIKKIDLIEGFLKNSERKVPNELKISVHFELVEIDWPKVIIAIHPQDESMKKLFLEEKETIPRLLKWLKGQVTDIFPSDKMTLILEEH